jgi:uncharacterized C2H2 Zn-finger protein
MTFFKCPQCGAVWTQGPTRDARFDQKCIDCVRNDADHFERLYKSADEAHSWAIGRINQLESQLRRLGHDPA